MGQVIFITGCGSGIGKEAAISLVKRGHRVIAATHHESDAKKLKAIAIEEKIFLETIVLDVTIPKNREKILQYDIDILINNAGIGESGSLSEVNIDKVRNNFEVNVFGPLELTQLVLRKMIKKNKGRVIFVSSLLGRTTMEFLGPYSMTKFALLSGSEMLRKELSLITDNVFVSVLEPGAYHTGFNQEMLSRKFEWMDKDSYFFRIKEEIRTNEKKSFDNAEQKSLKSIITKIIETTEARKPKLRYVAPWWQGFLVQITRALGK